jgi:hypothetical protein
MTTVKNLIVKASRLVAYAISSPLVAVIFFFYLIKARQKKRTFISPRLVFGSTPVISFSHWSKLLSSSGHDSTSYVNHVYSINNNDDWDVIRIAKKNNIVNMYSLILEYARALNHFDVFVMSCDGFLIGQTKFWRIQSFVLKFAGCKSVIIPYGGDSYVYSKVKSSLTLQGLMVSYPEAAKNQMKISRIVEYWVKHADIFVPGSMGLDGFGRWDFPTPSPFQVDLEIWNSSIRKNLSDGSGDPIVVAHAPNHRGFKGTQFISGVIAELQQEGLHIELLTIEGLPNSEVRLALSTKVDILVEQILFTGYALNAIEGLASGIPVISNLEDQGNLEYLRLWSFLSKTPIVSAGPTTLKGVLRNLVTNPDLRIRIGRESRIFAEEYHGKEACCFMFESILSKINDRKFNLQDIYNSNS